MTNVHKSDDAIRYFILYRHSDPTGVSGTGLVGYGHERRDGKATVRWLGSWPTETTHERGMASVEAVHGHGGRTAILYSETETELVLPSGVLPVAADAQQFADLPIEAHGTFERVRHGLGLEPKPHVLSQSVQDCGWVLGVGEPCREWLYVKCEDPQMWSSDSIVATPDRLVHGDLLVGVVINGERRMFWHESVTGTEALGWRDVVELFAARPESVIVSRLTPSCGGDPAYHVIRIR